MLLEETDPTRIESIKEQIRLNEDEISQLRQGKPLFGTPKPLRQETIIIEADPETKGQKITKLDETGKPTATTPQVTETEQIITNETITDSNPDSKKVGNRLRDILQGKKALSAEESLKAKVMAAKAAKSKII